MEQKIQIIKLTEKELEDKGVHSWPIWTCDISEFPWEYGEKESCYIIEGEVQIGMKHGKTISIKPGDYVIFPKGLQCYWTVLHPIRKHYKMG